jgi:hypothetical protein
LETLLLLLVRLEDVEELLVGGLVVGVAGLDLVEILNGMIEFALLLRRLFAWTRVGIREGIWPRGGLELWWRWVMVRWGT